MPRKQCKKCPWKVTTDPMEIPGGYSVEKHQRLACTVAKPGSLARLGAPLSMMACHESAVGREKPCVGWLAHQLGEGNNIPLRLAVVAGRVDADFELDGEQHTSLEHTLPKKTARRRTS